MKTRVSIVEDDEQTRRLLGGMIRRAPGLEWAGEHIDGAQAFAALPAERPDVVLMDINMPNMDGVECVRRLKLLLPNTQFLMLTVYEDSEHIFAALAAGATGYLLKSTRRPQLLEAIAQVVDGGSPMSSGIARKVVRSFAQARPADGVQLSAREKSVLDLLSRGFLYKEIADDLGVGGATVCTYIRRIYEKLQVHSRAQAVAKYLGQSPG